MEQTGVIAVVDFVARALELVGVAVIAVAFAHASLRAVVHFGRRRARAYEQMKVYLGKALLLGLEFLVAADIIRTVLIEPTTESILTLGLLVLVRIVLGWSIVVEVDGCWPWQVAERRGRVTSE